MPGRNQLCPHCSWLHLPRFGIFQFLLPWSVVWFYTSILIFVGWASNFQLVGNRARTAWWWGRAPRDWQHQAWMVFRTGRVSLYTEVMYPWWGRYHIFGGVFCRQCTAAIHSQGLGPGDLWRGSQAEGFDSQMTLIPFDASDSPQSLLGAVLTEKKSIHGNSGWRTCLPCWPRVFVDWSPNVAFFWRELLCRMPCRTAVVDFRIQLDFSGLRPNCHSITHLRMFWWIACEGKVHVSNTICAGRLFPKNN